MKIGVLIHLLKDRDVRGSFKELRDMGLDSCQLVCWDRDILHNDSVVKAVNEAVEAYGVHITAFWCGWEGRRVWDFYEGQLTLGLVPADYRVERMKMLLEGSDFAMYQTLPPTWAICRRIHMIRNIRRYWWPVKPLWKNVRRMARIFCLRPVRKHRLP
jgi:hypothetical protein